MTVTITVRSLNPKASYQDRMPNFTEVPRFRPFHNNVHWSGGAEGEVNQRGAGGRAGGLAYIHILSHIHIHIHIHIQTHTITCTYKHIQTHTHTNICKHISKHTHTHTHTGQATETEEKAAEYNVSASTSGPARVWSGWNSQALWFVTNVTRLTCIVEIHSTLGRVLPNNTYHTSIIYNAISISYTDVPPLL